MEKIKSLCKKYEELISYLFFGVVTTLCSLAVCFVTLKLGVLVWHDEAGQPTEFLDILGSTTQWISGVLVAFFTNKKWVFKNTERGLRGTGVQLVKFAGARVLTYFLEVGINLGAIAAFDACGYTAPTLTVLTLSIVVSSRLWAKVISSVLVVISNYFISKLMVFRKKKTDTEQ